MSPTHTLIQFQESSIKHYDAEYERKENVIGKRIAFTRKLLHLSLADFKRILEGYSVKVTVSSISKWENGETVPNSYQLMAICHALDVADVLTDFSSVCVPSLNPAGQQLLTDYKQLLIVSGLYAPEPPKGELIELPFSDLRVSAGFGQVLDTNRFETMQFPKSEVPAGADFALQVSGNSMEPVFCDGQTVFVKRQDSVSPGDVGIFCYDGEGYMKLYSEISVPSDTEPDGFIIQPMLISYNSKYAPIQIAPGLSFGVFGKVIK